MPYEEHPSAGDLPPPDTLIWRFMSLAKFLSFVTTSSLYFAQALQLRKVDPFEGSLTLKNRQWREEIVSNEEAARAFLTLPKDRPLPPNLIEFFTPERGTEIQRLFVATTYLNCWHMSPFESAFLWSNYASLTDGLAIRSTVGALCDSLKNEERAICIGPVNYIDYEADVIAESNAFNAFFCKRKSFSAENELRCCFNHLVDGVGWGPECIETNPKGIAIECSADVLVDQVLVSPFAPPWCTDLVRSICNHFGMKFEITKSSITDPAIL